MDYQPEHTHKGICQERGDIIENILVVIAAFLVTLSGAGAYTLQDASQFDKDVSEHVKYVQAQVDKVAAAQSTEPVLKFRHTWQNAQSDISVLYTTSERDSKLTPEELEKNKQYQAYLFSADQIITEYSEGRQPDRTELNKSSASLIIE